MKANLKLLRVVILICTFATVQSTMVYGSSIYWTAKGEDTAWETTLNWDTGATPASGNDVLLTEDKIDEELLWNKFYEIPGGEEGGETGPVRSLEVTYTSNSEVTDSESGEIIQYNSIEIDDSITQGIFLNQTSGTLNTVNMKVGTDSSGSYVISGDSVLNVEDTLNIGVSNGSSSWEGYEGVFEQNGGTVNANYICIGGNSDDGYSGTGSYQLNEGVVNVRGSLTIGYKGYGEFTQRGGIVNSDFFMIGASTYLYGAENGAVAGGYGTYNLEGGTLNSVEFYMDSQSVFNQSGGLNSIELDMMIGGSTGARGIYGLNDSSRQVRGEYHFSGGTIEVGYSFYTIDSPVLILGDGRLNSYTAANKYSGGYGIFIQSGGDAKFNGDVIIGDLDNTPPANPYATDYDPSDNPNGYGEGLYQMSGGTMLVEGNLNVGENTDSEEEDGIGVYYSKGIMEQSGGSVTVEGSLNIAAAPNLESSNLDDHNKYEISGESSSLTVNNNINVGSEYVTTSERWGKIAELSVSDQASITGDVTVYNGGVVSGTDGTIHGDLSLYGGVLSPGNSPGTITIDGTFYADSSSLIEIEILSLLDGGFDVINVLGNATLDGVTFYFDFTGFELGDLELEAFIGESFDFLNVEEELIIGDIDYEIIGIDWLLNIDFSTGNAVIAGVDDGNPSPVPVPSTILLLFFGLVGFAGTARQKFKR